MTFYQRRLPHWQPTGQDIFITWRLHGSLPGRILPPKTNSAPGTTFIHYDRILDRARTGPLWLSDTRIAESLLNAFIAAQRAEMMRLSAYVLMANHVHILWTPMIPLEKITHQIKGATTHQANLILSRAGNRFWQDESFDHWIRNPSEWQKIRAYIENNPVAAGLVARPENWLWSSASRPIV
jgi:REP element-mobilizing transposase RayT